jgi:hypothetical protein
VRAFIDSVSDFVLGPNAYWHNQTGAAPGLWNGHHDATLLNNAPWTPVWPQSGDNRDCDCDSQPTSSVPPLPNHAQTVAFQQVAGRGSIDIVQQPAPENGYVLAVEITDSAGGADTYEFVLTYQTQ